MSYFYVILVARYIFTFPPQLNLACTHTHELQSGLDHQSVGSHELQIEQLLLQAMIKLFS